MWAPDPSFPMGEHSLDLDYAFSSIAYFLTCPSPSLPGVSQAPLLSLRHKPQGRSLQPAWRQQGAWLRAGTGFATGKVCWALRMALNAKDCLCVYKKGFFGTALKLTPRLDPRTCLFQCIQCKIGSQDKKNSERIMFLFLLLQYCCFIISCINFYIIYFLTWLTFPSI